MLLLLYCFVNILLLLSYICEPVTESVAIAEGAKYRNTATVLPTTNILRFDWTNIFQDQHKIYFPAYNKIYLIVVQIFSIEKLEPKIENQEWEKIEDNASACFRCINRLCIETASDWKWISKKTTENHFICQFMRIVIKYCYLPEQQSIAGYFALKNLFHQSDLCSG